MNYGNQVAPVELDVSSESSCAVRLARQSTQPKCMGSTRRMCRVEPSGIWAIIATKICTQKLYQYI